MAVLLLAPACKSHDGPLPCDNLGRCLPGFVCIDDKCVTAPPTADDAGPAADAVTPDAIVFEDAAPPMDAQPNDAAPDATVGLDAIGMDANIPEGPGPADTAPLGRSCEMDPNVCDPSEPVCFNGTCTGTCAFNSDCPNGWCCRDVQGDGSPGNTICVDDTMCGPPNPAIPPHRRCQDETECARNGACVAGQCFGGGGNGLAQPGEACTSPTDCDLTASGHCVLRMPDGALIAGNRSARPMAVAAVCAPECGAGATCPAGSCCRLARFDDGPPRKYCFAQTSGNCGPVMGRYTTCDWVNPTTCDPTFADTCLFFELPGTAGQYCTSTCSGNVDCGAAGACCAVDTSSVSYCIQGLTSCPR